MMCRRLPGPVETAQTLAGNSAALLAAVPEHRDPGCQAVTVRVLPVTLVLRN